MCSGYDGRQIKKIPHFAIRTRWAEKNGLNNPRPVLYWGSHCGWPIKTYPEHLKDWESLLTRKLLSQTFLVVFSVKRIRRKLYFRHHVLVNQYQIYVSQKWKQKCSLCHNYNSAVSRFTTYHQTFDRCNMTGASSAARNAYPSGTPKFNCHTWKKMRCVRVITDIRLRKYLTWLYEPDEQKKWFK